MALTNNRDRMSMSFEELADDQDLQAVDLPPITEELSAAERAEFEHNLHLVQPRPSNKFVVLANFDSK